MKSFFKQYVSVGIMLLVICTQVALPVFQNREEKVALTPSIEHVHPIYLQESPGDSEFIISDIVDIFSLRVDVGHTLFYTLSDFSLEAFHGLVFWLKWNLYSVVNIEFTLADKIFPFACFW